MLFDRNCSYLVVTFSFKLAYMYLANKGIFIITYLSLNFFLWITHSLPSFFAGAEEEEEWHGVWGGEEDGICKANRIVTMTTINIQMVTMDSSVFSSHILFPAKIRSNWKSSPRCSSFWGHVIKKEHNFKVVLQITFWFETLKKHLENHNLRRKSGALVTKSWHKLTL